MPDLKIDKFNLDDELVHQSQNLTDVGEQLALALSVKDQAVEECKVLAARLSLEARGELEEAGERVTEGRVASEVATDPEHISAIRKLGDVKKEVEVLRARRDAWLQRGHALHDLVKLYLAGYFSENSTKKAESAKDDEVYEKVRRNSPIVRERVAKALEMRRKTNDG